MLKCRLRVIFAELEIKQKEFAEKVGISPTTMSSLVTGKHLPTLDVAFRIAEALEMSVHEIWIKEKGAE